LFPSVPFRTVPFSYISRRSGREGEIEKEIKPRILKGEVSLYHSPPEPNAIKIQGSVITGSCKYRKNLQGPVVFKLNAIKHIFPVFTGIFL